MNGTARDARIVTVFGSSRPQPGDADYGQALELGESLAGAGFAVCSGAYGGVMEAVSRGAKERGGKTYGVTSEFFRSEANRWIDVEIRTKTWQERLFELIRLGDAYVACRGGTGTLAELAVLWEMLNKGVTPAKPFIVLGDFWPPVIERVRQVESCAGSPWGEARGRMVQTAATPGDAARLLARSL
jgi:uncharacterized protein (TIGR00725 family)